MSPSEVRPASRTRPWRWLGWLGVMAVLATVFVAYLRPELALDLAGRLWSCF